MKDKRQIEALIEKYFEGLTSLEEEQVLRDYFQREDLPEELKIYAPLFQYFSSEREEVQKTEVSVRRNNTIRLVRWISISAAACLLLFLGVNFFQNRSRSVMETSFAYIDGKKYTNIEQIQIEALKALENLSDVNEDVYSSQIEALEFLELEIKN